MSKNLKSNVINNYIFSFLIRLSLTESIWMLYLAYRGMSLWQIGLLESIYHVFSLSFEMPTGMIADRFGRKISRILGRVMTFTACLLMLSSHSFGMFVLAFLFTALGNNLESGAGDALVYDSLIELGESEGYKKIKGRQEVFVQSAMLLSLVVGGAVATKSYELAYGITALIHFSSIFQAMMFVEPTVGKKEDAPVSFKVHMGESLKAIWANKHVFRYMLFIECFALFYTTLFFYLQNYMKSVGMTEYKIGFALAAVSLCSLSFSVLAHRIEPLIGQKNLIRWSSGAIILCLFGIGFTPYVVPFYLGMAMIDGLLYVSFSDYINQMIPSEYRATLLSFQSMLFSIMMILLFPVVGWVAQTWGFSASFKLIFALGVPVIAYAMIGLKKYCIQVLEVERSV